MKRPVLKLLQRADQKLAYEARQHFLTRAFPWRGPLVRLRYTHHWWAFLPRQQACIDDVVASVDDLLYAAGKGLAR